MDPTEPGILFVDDDVDLTSRFQNLFSNEFIIYTANNPIEALKLINKYHIGVVISDHYMPEMTGIDFFALILKEYPLIRRMLISGNMDVNIVMQSIRISKVHKLIVKPLIPEELEKDINAQLNIYKLRMDYKSQVDGLKQQIKKPFELNKIQTQELVSNFNPAWNNDYTDYSARLIIGVNIIVKFAKMYLDVYLEDPNKYAQALEYIKQNLDDLNVIAINYKQFKLQFYTLILYIYYSLLVEDFDEAKNHYMEFLLLFHSNSSIFEDLWKRLNQPSFTYLGANIEDDIVLDPQMIDSIRQTVLALFDFDITPEINLNLNFLQYSYNLNCKFHYFLIMKNDYVVYFKNMQSNIDSIDLYSSIELLQRFSLELNNKSEIVHTIDFKGGIVLIQSIETIKFILIVSENNLESRLKLRKFIFESIDIINSIPVLSIPKDDDIKHINKLSKELFDM